MKPFRVLAVPQTSPEETKTMPEWVTVLADSADEAMQKFLKERSKTDAKLG